MTTTDIPARQIQAFSEAYDYDVSYLRELLEATPEGFAAFQQLQGLSAYRSALPLDAHFVARVAATEGQDCGSCAQLNLRMAVEAGVDRELLRTLIDSPRLLPAALQDVRDHAHAAASGAAVDPDRVERLQTHYGRTAFAELALAVAGSALFPLVKRALHMNGACGRPTVDF